MGKTTDPHDGGKTHEQRKDERTRTQYCRLHRPRRTANCAAARKAKRSWNPWTKWSAASNRPLYTTRN